MSSQTTETGLSQNIELALNGSSAVLDHMTRERIMFPSDAIRIKSQLPAVCKRFPAQVFELFQAAAEVDILAQKVAIIQRRLNSWIPNNAFYRIIGFLERQPKNLNLSDYNEFLNSFKSEAKRSEILLQRDKIDSEALISSMTSFVMAQVQQAMSVTTQQEIPPQRSNDRSLSTAKLTGEGETIDGELAFGMRGGGRRAQTQEGIIKAVVDGRLPVDTGRALSNWLSNRR